MTKYHIEPAPNGEYWEHCVIRTSTGNVAYPEHGYASKAKCADWIDRELLSDNRRAYLRLITLRPST